MNVFRMAKLDDEDNVELRRLTEFVNMAAAFFEDRTKPEPKPAYPGQVIGRKAIEKLASGNTLDRADFDDALREIVKAQARLRKRKPDMLFPRDLKAQYEENLSEAGSIVQSWIDQLY